MAEKTGTRLWQRKQARDFGRENSDEIQAEQIGTIFRQRKQARDLCRANKHEI
jgi:hypothetical protein